LAEITGTLRALSCHVFAPFALIFPLAFTLKLANRSLRRRLAAAMPCAAREGLPERCVACAPLNYHRYLDQTSQITSDQKANGAVKHSI
jgi:hypothetical protein